jgi:hypothetical protein
MHVIQGRWTLLIGIENTVKIVVNVHEFHRPRVTMTTTTTAAAAAANVPHRAMWPLRDIHASHHRVDADMTRDVNQTMRVE